MDKQTRNHILQIIVIGTLFYCCIQRLDVIFLAITSLFQLLKPFLIGIVIAFIFNVPMKNIEKNLFVKKEKCKRFRRPLAYVITLICVFGVVAIVLAIVIPELMETFSVLVEQIPRTVTNIQQWVLTLLEENPSLEALISELKIDWTVLSDMAVNFVTEIATNTFNSGIGIITGIIGGITTFVIAFVFSIYILMQKEQLSVQIKGILNALLPNKATEKILAAGTLANQVFTNFLSGQCVEAIILGTMFVATMTVFRMPYAMLTGIIIAITALIPIFGAFVGCGVGVLLILIESPGQALGFVILFLILQQIEGNFIYPHVVGNSVGLPSIWVLVAVTVGGSLFGIPGILLFIPLGSIAYAMIRDFIKKRL